MTSATTAATAISATEALAGKIYVELVGRAVFASGSPVEPDGKKLSEFSIKLAQAFQTAIGHSEQKTAAAQPAKFDMGTIDIDAWQKK